MLIPTLFVSLSVPVGVSPDAPLYPNLESELYTVQQDSRRESRSRRHYLQLGAGLVTASDADGPGEEIDFDEGFALSAAFGRHYGDRFYNDWVFDLELEGIYTDQDTGDRGVIRAVRDVTTAGLLVNGIAEFPLNDRLGVYGGGGLGIAWLSVGTRNDSVFDFKDEDGPFFAWQAKAGLRFDTRAVGIWNLGYRFLNIDEARLDDNASAASFDLDTEQHVLELGVRLGL